MYVKKGTADEGGKTLELSVRYAGNSGQILSPL